MFAKQRRLLPALVVATLMALTLPPVAYADEGAVATEVAVATTPAEEPAAPAAEETQDGNPDELETASETAVEEAPAEVEEATPADSPAETEEAATAPIDADEPAEALEKSPEAASGKASTKAAAAAVDCPPTDRSDTITSITLDQNLVDVWDVLNVKFSAVFTDGGCEGDFIKIPLPPRTQRHERHFSDHEC